MAVLLTVAGIQVPVMPFVDISGRTGATAPEQIAGTRSKVGVTVGLTVTASVIVVAQSPAVGVNV